MHRHRLPPAPAVAFRALLAVAFLTALPASAELSARYRDWADGPARHLFTTADRDGWAKVATDAEAEDFIRLFWARRDPNAETAENEFQHEFERRTAYADQKFGETRKDGEVRGSLTDRGRIFLMFGPPRRVQQPGAGGVEQGGDFGFGESGVGSGRTGGVNDIGAPGRGGSAERFGAAAEEIWIYEEDHRPEFIKRKRAQIRFRTKPGTEEVHLFQGEEALGWAAEAAARAVVRPDLRLADLAPATGSSLAAAAAAPGPGGFSTWGATPGDAAAAQALAGALAVPPAVDAHLDSAAFQASDGTWVVPIQVAVTGAAPAGTALVGELLDAEGASKLVFRGQGEWREARDQKVVKATVVAPPGTYELHAGLAGGDGRVVWAGADQVEIPADPGFWVSEVLLSDMIYPMDKAQELLEPFAWQGIVVVPRGDRTFHQGGILWFYLHACSPQLSETGKPNLKVNLQLDGPAPFRGPMTVDPVKAGDDCWVVAQGLDLPADRFPAGDYKLRVNVRDALAAKTLVTPQTTFHVVAGG